MTKTKLAIFLVVIGVAILFAANNDLYAGAGATPWPIGTAPKKSTTWTGTLVITGEIANVPGLPAPYLPADATPTPPSTGYRDLLVKIEFFVRLQNSSLGYATFSGLARDNEGYYFFYALSDYANGRIGEALQNFLVKTVNPNLPGGPYPNIVLTSLINDVQNVGTQLRINQQTGQESLQPESPLYLNANITVGTW